MGTALGEKTEGDVAFATGVFHATWGTCGIFIWGIGGRDTVGTPERPKETGDGVATLSATSTGCVPAGCIIGPKTSKALSGLQKQLAAGIEKFQALRNEGKMLAENDKIEEALKKYQAAYAIIPAKDVAAQIDALKKQ